MTVFFSQLINGLSLGSIYALIALGSVSYTHLYTLTGAKMKEIQAVNACRRDAVAKGMKLEEAMDKWQTMDQLPAEYRS